MASLEAVGLDPIEERAYLSLLRTPARGPEELAQRLGVGAGELSGVLESLKEHGLVRADGARGLKVVPPDRALGGLLLRHQARLQQAQGAVARIVEEYRGRAALHESDRAVEVVTGREEVADRFLDIQAGAGRSVCALVMGSPIAVHSEDNHVAEASIKAGVPHRVVYDRRRLERDRRLRLDRWLDLGEEIRISDDVPMKLTVVDDRVAFLPAVADPVEEPSAIVVRESGLLDALVWVFETVWRSAVPYPATGGPEGEGLGEEERRLLALMLAGGTDASIAKQLGVSERTVQRRVGGLADLVGARTRLQLVWKAAKRGWL